MKYSTNPKIEILTLNFNLLILVGCWRPIAWSPKFKRAIYKLYTIFVIIVVHVFSFTQFMDIILNVRNMDEFTQSIYMLCASFMSCCKIVTLVARRRSLEILTETLRRRPCEPMDDRENEIQREYDQSIGSLTKRYTILVEVTVACAIVSSLLTDLRDRKLAFRAWYPYDYTISWIYIIAYIHQTLAHIATSLLNVACDSLISGFLVHVCGQIEILKYRLERITIETKDDFKQCVIHHNLIYRYASIVNDKFKTLIGIQFFVSTLVVCVTLYRLTNTPIGSKYFEFALYMACMMAQIFFYCWNGNRLKLKSTEVIYTIFAMDWLRFDQNTRSDLKMIMKRSAEPIEIIGAFVVPMDLDTFVKILKISYSIYNFLESRN